MKFREIGWRGLGLFVVVSSKGGVLGRFRGRVLVLTRAVAHRLEGAFSRAVRSGEVWALIAAVSVLGALSVVAKANADACASVSSAVYGSIEEIGSQDQNA